MHILLKKIQSLVYLLITNIPIFKIINDIFFYKYEGSRETTALLHDLAKFFKKNFLFILVAFFSSYIVIGLLNFSCILWYFIKSLFSFTMSFVFDLLHRTILALGSNAKHTYKYTKVLECETFSEHPSIQVIYLNDLQILALFAKTFHLIKYKI